MKVRTAIAGTGLSAILTVTGCGTMTILASAAVSACSGGSTPTPTGSPSFSPGKSASPTPSESPSGAAAGSASPHTGSGSPSASPAQAAPGNTDQPPNAAPATGGGGTSGLQDTLLFALGGAAVLAGAGSLAYRRKVIRNR
jgi:hypothetical protein